jgi:phosphoketolase
LGVCKPGNGLRGQSADRDHPDQQRIQPQPGDHRSSNVKRRLALGLDAAERHVEAGAGVWEWAGHGAGDPDVVLGCAGGIPTVEVLAAAALLRVRAPDLIVRVVDLLALTPPTGTRTG